MDTPNPPPPADQPAPTSAAQPPKPEQPTPPPRRVKKRFLIPGIVLGLIALLVVGAYVRGTWADTTPRDPVSVEDGIICQLYQTPEGHKPVRCAVLLDHPIDKVWKVLSNYSEWHEVFPTLASQPLTVQRGVPEGDGHFGGHVSGVASSLLGDWPFSIHVTEKLLPNERVISWTGGKPNEDVRVIRGSFTLTPREGNKTLLVYSLEVELARYPNFLVRNVLLGRQPGVVRALRERLNKG
jgi:hypothetical protein